jgi:tight adherence protein C
MILLFVLGAAMVVLALILLSRALAGGDNLTGVNRSIAVLQAMSEAPAELTKDIDPPFADRVLAPLQARALKLSRRVTGADTSERFRHKLELAGNPAGLSVDRLLSGKVLLAGVGLLIGLAFSFLLGLPGGLKLIVTLGGLVAGFFSPDMYLAQLSYNRRDAIQKGLPDAIDLLTISVESGLGFDAAIMQVARNTDGPLADEFARVLREMQLGVDRAEALRGLGDRTDLPELKGFVSSMVQADSFGIPIAQVLRVQSAEMRLKRRQRAEEMAQKVPVKITVPLIFCILPTLFVVVIGPAVLSVIDNFG